MLGQSMELVLQTVEKEPTQEQEHVQTQLLLLEELIVHCLVMQQKRVHAKSKNAQVKLSFSVVIYFSCML